MLLLRKNRRNMETKIKNLKKYLVRDRIEQITLQTVPKYALF